MNSIDCVIKQDEVERKTIKLRNKNVIIDAHVAELYGVTTKEINQAVNRNSDKFPRDYVFRLTKQEKEEEVTNCDLLQSLKFSNTLPRAFTESGLYMLATILKSPRATKTTISIIDTFTKVREIDRTINQISNTQENAKKNELMQKTGELITDLIIPDVLDSEESETSIELNFAVVKFKYKVKKKQKNGQMVT